jgi:protocatechuate 3,4-dioxygenase beta subunit
MRGVAFLTSGLIAIAVSACVHSFAPTRAKATPGAATAIVRGRVYDRVTRRPLPGAVVRIKADPHDEWQRVTTDAAGRYELSGLRPGDYWVQAHKDDYLDLSYGQSRPTDFGADLKALAGFTYDNTDFALSRGGAISGRVVDEHGDPAVNAMVSVRFLRFNRDLRELAVAGSGTQVSDALGVYRVVDLDPGEYYVSATIRPPRTTTENTDHIGHSVTFFPGTAKFDDARRVSIGVGSTAERVDIALIPAALATISGTVVDASGNPVTAGRVSAGDRTRISSGASGAISPDGTFALPGLPPGQYILHAFKAVTNLTNDGLAMATVTIEGRDVDGVRLAYTHPSTVSGRIIADPSVFPALQSSYSSVLVRSLEPQSSSASGGRINSDLTFTAAAYPGRHTVGLERVPPGWYVKVVRVDRVDVTDSTINVMAHQDIGGVEIELGVHPTLVTGTVNGTRGVLPKNHTVVIFSHDQRHWGGASRYVATSIVTPDWHFSVSALPSGEYYAAAIDSPDHGRSADPEFLARLRLTASTLSLREGETRTLALKSTQGS